MKDALDRGVRGILSRVTRGRPPADEEQRADWDARTLVRLLDREQLRRYAETDDPSLAAELIARERLRALRSPEPLTPTQTEEELLAAPWRWARAGERVLAALQVLVLVFGWTFLIAGIIGILGVPWLIWVSAGALAVSTLALTGRSLTVALIDRWRVRPLLERASHTPGQLGRGLPGSTPTSTVSGALDLMVYVTAVIMLAAGVGAIGIGALTAGIDLIFWAVYGDAPQDLAFSGQIALVGLVLLALTLLLARVWGAMVQADRRRISALEWLVER